MGHGIQIFDFKKLLKIDPKKPVVFDAKKDLTSHFNAFLPVGRAHNVVVNEELRYAVAVGAMPRNDPICASGLNFFDLTDPSKPKSLGCAKGDGYVHDAQCIVSTEDQTSDTKAAISATATTKILSPSTM